MQAWGLSLAGGVGVVLGFVVWQVVLGGVFGFWFFHYSLCGSVACPRGSASLQNEHVFFGFLCIWHLFFGLMSQQA